MKHHLLSLLAATVLSASHSLWAQAPVLTATSPTRQASSTPVNSPIVLTFSQPMHEATASGTAITVRGSRTGVRSLVGKGTFSGGNTNQITFNPATAFLPGEKVSVSVTGRAQSTGGVPLAKPQVYDFTAATKPATGVFSQGQNLGNDGTLIASADWDNDGDTDLMQSFDHYIQVLLNNGTGQFTKGDTIGTYASGVYNLSITDLDIDGDIDLVYENYVDGIAQVRTQLNDGKAHFSPGSPIALISYPGRFSDIDGDGDPDFFSNVGNQAVFFRNNGKGQFPLTDTLRLQYPTSFKTGKVAAVADFDNDGDQDAWVTDYQLGEYYMPSHYLFTNDGTGHFAYQDSIAVGDFRQGYGNFAGTETGDWNRDGHVDVLLFYGLSWGNGCSERYMSVRLNDGSGNFAQGQLVDLGPTAVAAPGDFDGDGDLDVLITSTRNPCSEYLDYSSMQLLANEGDGTFRLRSAQSNGGIYMRLLAADYDGDGDLDVAADKNVWLNENKDVNSCTADGRILREYWANVKGNRTDQIPFNQLPTSTSYLTSFEAPSNVAERYASRIRGYLCAPETGNYTFWIAADDYGDLYLSTDDNPANKAKIAYIKGYAAPWQWNKHYSQKSALVYLEKGKRYYIEALQKEDWVNDNLAVAWRLPSSPVTSAPVVIPGSVLSPFPVSTINQLVLRPSAAEGKDALLISLYPTLNQGNNPYFSALAWTVSGEPTTWRSLLQFDLSALPANAVIVQARLSLYHNTNTHNPQHSNLTGVNQSYLRRVTSPWEEQTATRNTQPSSTTRHQVLLPTSETDTQDYLHVDVTELVKDMTATTNYGFLIQLAQESYYRAMMFSSSDAQEANLHPELVVEYVLSTGAARETVVSNLSAEEPKATSLMAYPNPFTDQVSIRFTAQETGRAVLELYDTKGVRIHSLFEGSLQAGEQRQVEMPATGLNQGLYVLRLTNGKQSQYLKLVYTK